MTERVRIALVVSHPIQHFCPQYASFAKHPRINFKVFFGSALGLKKYIDPDFQQEISWGNLQLENFDHIFLNGEESLPSNKHLDALSLEKELKAFTPNIVIVYGYFQKLQRRALKWARQNNIAVGYISDSEKRQRRNLFKEIFKRFFLWRYFKNIEYFLTVGDANEAFYRFYGVPDRKFVRMHFPIDVNHYEKCFELKSVLRRQIRIKFGIPENEFVMIVVGKLVHWKNQDHLIDALKLLEQRNIKVHLFIIGSGETTSILKQKASFLKKNKVYFPGFVNIDELPAYYAACDCYIHPASVEPHSLSISEAVYMGCPVILSDRCGSHGESDDVRHNENGYVYKFGDIRHLASLVANLYLNSTLLAQFSRKSHLIATTQQEISHRIVLDHLVKRMRI